MSELVFDLDGTLSDPLEGVVRSIGHAFAALGRPIELPEVVRSVFCEDVDSNHAA